MQLLRREWSEALAEDAAKRDGLSMVDLDSDYSYRVVQFQSSFGVGANALLAEVESRLEGNGKVNRQFRAKVIAEIRFRLGTINTAGELLGFSFHPRYQVPNVNVTFETARQQFVKAPLFCDLCGMRMASITATVFKHLRVCPRCLFVKLMRMVGRRV